MQLLAPPQFNKFAWSGVAVVLAVVLALGVMAPRPASATVTTPIVATTNALTTNATNGSQAFTSLSPIVMTATAANDFPVGTVALVAPTGWQFGGTAGVVTVGTGNATVGANGTLTLTVGAFTAGETIVIGATTYTIVACNAASSVTAATSIAVQVGGGCNPASTTTSGAGMLANIVQAINGQVIPGSVQIGTTANASVSAVLTSGTVITLTPRTAGVAAITPVSNLTVGTLAVVATGAGAAATFATSGATTTSADGATAFVTVTTANAAGSTLTITGLQARPLSIASATGNVTYSVALSTGPIVGLANGTAVATITAGASFATPYGLQLFAVPIAAGCLNSLTTSTVTASVPADGTGSFFLCAILKDANNVPIPNVLVTFTSSGGIVSTGSAKTTGAFTIATAGTTQGAITTAYRGSGGVAATDTVIASVPALYSGAIATLSITITAPTGTTASKISLGSPDNASMGAVITGSSPAYVAPVFGSPSYAVVSDAVNQGVNGQTVLLTIDRGSLVDGRDAPCAGVTAKSITASTASEAQVIGGSVLSGTVAFTICTNSSDAPGKATITAQNMSTAMANATQTVSMAGRPAKISATATGNTISATVTDAAGNNVANGTVVRFTISTNAGAVSTGCTVTSNGAATTVVALIASTGTVIVSTDWNETGVTVPGCSVVALGPTNNAATVSSGSQSLAASVAVPGGTSTAGATTPAAAAPAVAGSGLLVGSGTVPKTGSGLIVFGGGTTDQLVTASGCAKATSSFYATNAAGEFVTFVPGTTIAAVNAGFTTLYAAGIPANTALIGKCA